MNKRTLLLVLITSFAILLASAQVSLADDNDPIPHVTTTQSGGQ